MSRFILSNRSLWFLLVQKHLVFNFYIWTFREENNILDTNFEK